MSPDLPELAGVRHTYHQVNGFRQHVAEAGDPGGEPLVMVHGWPQHWWCWHKVIPALSERYRVICPDLRGHGWSDAPEGGYAKPQLARDLVELLDVLGLDRVRLMGHDWGSMAGFLACIRRPERFERFLPTSIAPPFPPVQGPKAVLQAWRLYYQLPLTLPVIAPRLVKRPSLLEVFFKAGTMRDDAISQADLDLYTSVLAARPHVTLGMYRTFITREAYQLASGAWAGRLTVPTRVVVGEGDIVADAEKI
ncbi:MAG TPA: alpha/beta fold hydrolase, partial [Pseudonocardia sp.]|nr:alpha/beta fold hydrolase [Pseudonocardia sp.]